jgi:3-hydroxybutyryl-CoA dehydrogenase
MAATLRVDGMSAKATIAVIGAGLMGTGIAQVFAARTLDVALYDAIEGVRATALSRIRDTLAIVGMEPAVSARVHIHDNLETAISDADFIFEAVSENLPLKQEIFARVEAAAKPDAILASNTSVIPITSIMAGLADRSRGLGTHWWNPPYLVPLVEVIRTLDTSDRAVRSTLDLLNSVGKTAVEVKRDVAGFVGNRMQHALWREAISIVAEGVCDAETVDAVVKASFGRRLAVLGPLENADMVGADLTLAIHQYLLPHIDAMPAPSPYLEKLVADGKLGFKSGEGFRRWTAEQQAQLRRKVADHLMMLSRAGI